MVAVTKKQIFLGTAVIVTGAVVHAYVKSDKKEEKKSQKSLKGAKPKHETKESEADSGGKSPKAERTANRESASPQESSQSANQQTSTSAHRASKQESRSPPVSPDTKTPSPLQQPASPKPEAKTQPQQHQEAEPKEEQKAEPAAKPVPRPDSKPVTNPRGGPKYSNIFVLGGPGSGKGTQSAMIVEHFGYIHLSAGDLLRAERSSGTEMADLINGYIREGTIVPAEITVRLLRKAMDSSGGSMFLIDGFPRNMENLECWKQLMSQCCKTEFLLFLDCPEEVMEQRLLKRGETSGRDDDNREAIRKRFHTYQNETRPIIEYFTKQKKTRRVDATRDVMEVYADVRALLEFKVVFVLGGPGSGKGTQCTRIAKDFGFVHLSAGDLLRAERSANSELGEMIQEHIREGKIVPAEITVRLLRKAMQESGERLFLIDGFPRNVENLEAWDKEMHNISKTEYVLLMECPEGTMADRLLQRGQASGGEDENREAVVKRCEHDKDLTMPIVGHFLNEKKVKKVDASKSIDEVYAQVKRYMQEIA